MKKWNKPVVGRLGFEKTNESWLVKPSDNKCTNNNGNQLNCERNPNNDGYYQGEMFYCSYYDKYGHYCSKAGAGDSPS